MGPPGPAIDFDALRAQTLGAGNDEAVTVNTRALIDKVLARYSGEWTTLRELLQNAADASSKHVKIRFETLPSSRVPVPQIADDSIRLRHVLLHHTMKSMTVENDGQIFGPKDWARLKKIAEGNPDETKIGAFGVGFYSVFSDCEEPFVSSGKDALAFYWRGDALYTKSRRLPNDQTSKTTFVLPHRNRDAPVPSLLSLCRFLASSLTFVGLERIELWLDDWKLMTLNKKNAPDLDVRIPKEVIRKTKEGLMHVDSLTKEAAQLDAEWLKVVEWTPRASQPSSDTAAKSPPSTQSLRSFFTRLAPGSSSTALTEKLVREEREKQDRLSEDLMGSASATLFVHVNRATIKTSVSHSFSAELERATKKPPPKNTTVSLLSASYDENAATSASSSGSSSGSSKIFDSFVPTNGKGRIFIGFTTNQTTGLNVHISTPSVIPTVERESIDLNNRFVRTWNVELLRVGGIVARIAWSNEMSAIQDKLSRKVEQDGRRNISKDDIDRALPEALYLHTAYNFSETTPAAEVGNLMEEAFWICNQKVTIATLSTRGVMPASRVRLEPEDLSFVDGIPFMPKGLVNAGLVQKLINYGIITETKVADIKSELESKAVSAAQLRQFLAWLLQKVWINEIDAATAHSLLSVTVANDDEGGQGKIIVLAETKAFLNPSRISPDLPVPPYVIPFKFTKDVSKANLELLFEDLQLVPWLRWIVENVGGRGGLTAEQDITQNAAFASTVLPVLSKQWEGLSSTSRATVIDLLSSRTTIPTKMGMRRPTDAYFPTVKLFDDLPTVTVHAVKDRVLAALGVRKTIEIGVVFDRLLDPSRTQSSQSQIPNSSAKWSHVDLIKYLASVKQDIPKADIERLRSTKICPAETESLQASKERYLVSELYRPDQAIRKLKLPTLHWPGVYLPESSEGRFLASLGLMPHPSYQDLIKIMADSFEAKDFVLRDYALRYFIDHHQTKGYASFDHSSVPMRYLPIQGSDERVALPKDVFVNERAAILGFDILRRDLQVHALKFGVKQDPPIATCVHRLVAKPPHSKREAREKFGYMAGRASELSNNDEQTLHNAKIVPITVKSKASDRPNDDKVGERIRYIQPNACYLSSGDSRYADIFDYVDFGKEANIFLLRVGSKHEPSIGELARRLVNEPSNLFSVLGDARYLELLRKIGDQWSALKKDKSLVKDMRSSKCLLAYKEIASKRSANEEVDEEEEEESSVKSWDLARAQDIVINDEVNIFRVFKGSLLAAPAEESLETLYFSLGSAEIGSLLEERHTLGSPELDQSAALQLQQHLHERMRLYLHDFAADSIKHDHNWIRKNMTVQSVRSISVTSSLKGHNLRHKASKRAVLLTEKPVLCITNKFDMLEVSQALAPMVLKRVKPGDIVMLETMLESTLSKLSRRGYVLYIIRRCASLTSIGTMSSG